MSKKRHILIVLALTGLVLGALAFRHLGPLGGHFVQARTDHGHEDGEGGEHDEHEERSGEATGGHDEHGEEKIVRLGEAESKEFGIVTAEAGPGKLRKQLSLTGKITLNEDRLAHIYPRVGGVVREVRKSLGDRVVAGEVMAIIESRELSDSKAAYLAARERLQLADVTFRREERLWKEKIASEQDYLDAKRVLAEARIDLHSAEQKLHALGFSEKYLAGLSYGKDESLTIYPIVAPFGGTVIKRHIALGEVLEEDSGVFVVANLDSVWIDLSVYSKDLPYVRQGQKALISREHGLSEAEGIISYMGPVVGEETRTALARVVLPNPDGGWRPGLFVTAKVLVEEIDAALAVPKSAIQTIDGKSVVFVRDGEGFEPHRVSLGRSDEKSVEILSGLSAGQRYAAKGGFMLKAELAKGSLDDSHSH